MKKSLLFFIVVLSLLCSTMMSAFAEGDTFTQKDRELLIRLDERLNQMDKRFELIEQQIVNLRKDMNARFEQVDKRFEQVDKRFEEVNKRVELIIYLMISIVSAFAAIVAVAIGFAIWDRRTMIRPFEDKVKSIELDITKDREKINLLIKALRKLAHTDPKVANVLKSFSLL